MSLRISYLSSRHSDCCELLVQPRLGVSYVTVIVALRLRCVEAEMIVVPVLSQHAYDEDVDVPDGWSVYKFPSSKPPRNLRQAGLRSDRGTGKQWELDVLDTREGGWR